jgi:hypothetical protein
LSLRSDLDSVGELYSEDDFRQLVVTVEATPAFLGGLGELEDHGVKKEAQAGQRTTLDVLNSQQDLTAAGAGLIGAQRDRVIAAYTLLAAVGRLDVKTLGLNTPDDSPEVHYHQVHNARGGLRTPSGQQGKCARANGDTVELNVRSWPKAADPGPPFGGRYWG